MLRDSGHIQETEAEWQNRKGKRSGKERIDPLYTVKDAEKHLFDISSLSDTMSCFPPRKG